MNGTQALHDLGQSIWMDNITRDLLDDGTLRRYIDELSVTGLTSNPTIFYQAIKGSTAYDGSMTDKRRQGKSGEELFFDVAIEDLTRAADLFRPIFDATNGVDGWVSLKYRRCSPTMPRRLSGSPKIYSREPVVPTCTSRFLARRKAFLPLSRQSLPACP